MTSRSANLVIAISQRLANFRPIQGPRLLCSTGHHLQQTTCLFQGLVSYSDIKYNMFLTQLDGNKKVHLLLRPRFILKNISLGHSIEKCSISGDYSSQSINQSINQSVSQSIRQLGSRSVSQSINHFNRLTK